jgi:hypothetical protein
MVAMTASSHWFLRAQIIRWVDDYQPGIVECRFTDALGQEWSVIEKLPILTDANLWSDSEFPQPAFIACQIIRRDRDDVGHEVASIDTQNPWAIEATDGTTSFRVFARDLTESPC